MTGPGTGTGIGIGTGTGNFFFKNIKISDPVPGIGTGHEPGTGKSPGKSPVQSPGHVPGPVPDRYRSSNGPVPFSVSGTEELLYF